MDRRKQMAEAVEDVWRKLFAARCRLLEQEYRSGECREEAAKVFEQLFRLAVNEQKDTSWLGISSLHTSLETGSHEFLLSLYGSEFYFDPVPLEIYWRPPVFSEYFTEDAAAIMKMLHSKFPRIWQYEENYVLKVCMEYYLAAFCQLCRDLKDDVMKTDSFRQAVKTSRFTAFFGQYRGEGEILWRTGEV